MPSSRQPTPINGAALDDPTARDRAEAGRLLASRGVFGLVWISDDLVVQSRFGSVVDFIEPGLPLTASVPACVGLEDDIGALISDPESLLRIPNVATITASDRAPRFNYVFYRLADRIVLVVAHASTGGPLEVELSRQVRARLIAEAAVAAKSQELSLANAELRVANAKLEQFAALASHDLNAPMRALHYMVEDTRAALNRGDSAAANAKLDALHAQSKRLAAMLSSLLRYSSAGPRELMIEQVDTHALVNEIVRSLPAQNLHIEVRGTWPRLETLSTPLDLVLRNLVDNAIKHHDREHGRIILTCTDHPSALEIAVSDDGPGIAPEHFECVFLPFQTMSGDGAGMGLAIVQKMIAAAGGSIRIHRNPDQHRGVTFVVHWPK
jgi:signal transduction histidine kinase